MPPKPTYCYPMKISAVAALLLACATATPAQLQKRGCCEFSANKKPQWQRVFDVGSESPEDTCGFKDNALAYTEPRRIVVGFHGYCFQRAAPGSARTADVLLLIDAETGVELNRQRWEYVFNSKHLPPSSIEIFPTRDGRFLVKEGP